ncbi:ommochrome-binding protein [Manduca sexta]|uniref:ommochrome-binding protein n=1 Tax=Manduca sexta TaxID=7130 RepID=UPI00188F38DD|nr:ommochrome-binding protein [Manduca sexta]XP_030036361.2 ommochrome-binding protein [Manduca sexta]XP_037293807.1 ommochrome-binding protein [Manduca sexta]XP_037301428.1 ommochrome-binding protein [Manduca sexta]XP_037301429.1 ommochrome-binding protein [Manduca sexta]
MKLLILTICALHVNQMMASKDCVVVNGKNYEKEVLKDNIHQAYQLSFDPQQNTLFFSYSDEVDSKTVLKMGYLNLATKSFGEISGVKDGMATAVDTTNHIVYLGGKDGIYTYDYATKSVKNLGVTSLSIWQMFYCPIHGLFFTTSDEKPYVFKDGQVKQIVEASSSKTRVMAVGEHHDVFFANSSGIFLFNHHTNKVVDLGDYNVNAFTKDSKGKLYFSSPVGFYAVNEADRKMNKLISETGEDSIWGAAFDKDDNIVYSNEDNIVKLVPKDKC